MAALNDRTGLAISRCLDFDTSATEWAIQLESLGEPSFDVSMPAPENARAILERLGAPARDAEEVAATMPSAVGTPEWWWLLERSCHFVVEAMGDPDVPHFTFPEWAGSEEEWSLRQRCFMAHLYLATIPHTMAWHRSRSIAKAISWASLSDLGRHMEIHRRSFRATGVDAAWWLTFSLRAEVFDLGRLQFNWFHLGVGDDSPLWYPPEEAEERGPGFRRGDFCVGIHVPDSGGPLTPRACDESFAMARRFFHRHFPSERGQGRRLATCYSWLLDDQLPEWLPEDSNIVRFQRRFELVPGWLEGDDAVLEFVFRVPHPLERLDQLPQRTRLERAVVTHIKSGGHWRLRTGWIEI